MKDSIRRRDFSGIAARPPSRSQQSTIDGLSSGRGPDLGQRDWATGDAVAAAGPSHRPGRPCAEPQGPKVGSWPHLRVSTVITIISLPSLSW